MLDQKSKLVVIGGGTGNFALLTGLKHYFGNLSVVVNMSDDGGSTGILRDELGALPPGDIRQCLVALSNSQSIMRDLFNYRFGGNTFAGHSFGNLFLTALEKTTGSFAEGVKRASEILNCSGEVIPVTLDNASLVMQVGEREIRGENKVSSAKLPKSILPSLRLEPKVSMNPEAVHAVLDADIVVIAPGNIYGSIIPALLPIGMNRALNHTKARILYVSNLVTKPSQTDDFTVADFAEELERFIGKGTLDYVLYDNSKPSEYLINKYAESGEHWVSYDEAKFKDMRCTPIGSDIISRSIPTSNKNDILLRRTLIRHDGAKVAKAILKYILKSVK